MTNAAFKVHEFMTTNLVTVGLNDTVAEATLLMKNNWIRHLPVVDENKQVVGMLSDRDLYGVDLDLAVQTIMKQPTRIVDRHSGLEEVIDQMIQSKVSSCLIEDEGKIVGIVTSEDLLRVLQAYLDKPTRGSVRSVLYDYIIKYPLGAAAQTLANMGI